MTKKQIERYRERGFTVRDDGLCAICAGSMRMYEVRCRRFPNGAVVCGECVSAGRINQDPDK